MLIEFDLSSQPGGERLAVERVAEGGAKAELAGGAPGQLKLALAQAARKAMECCCRYHSEAPLAIWVLIPENDPAPREANPANGGPDGG